MTDIDDPLLEIEQRELAEKAEKQKLKELEIAIKKTLETVEGRRVFQWILDMTAVDSSVTSQDMTLMTIASARRDIGLQILNRLKGINLELVRRMENEKLNGSNRRNHCQRSRRCRN